MLHRVSRQGAIAFLSRGASVLLGLTATILLSRVLGPSGFGKFRLGSVVIQLLTTCCVLGLDKALQRYLPIVQARGGAGSRALLLRGTSVVIGISLTLFTFLLWAAPAVANYYFRAPEMATVIRVFSFQLPVFALFRFLSGAVAATKRFDFASKITNILSPAIFLMLLGLVGIIHPTLYGAIVARIIAQLAAVVCLTVFLLGHYPRVSQDARPERGIFKDYFLLSMPLFVIAAGYQLLNQMDTIMLGHFVTEREVGIYSVAYKVSAFVVIGLEIMLPIVAPLFSQFSETREYELTSTLFRTVTRWLSYSALVIFTCIVIFRLELLHVFGKAFTSGGTMLVILAAGQLANAVTGPTGVLLTMTGRQKWELANVTGMVAFNFLLNLILIPRMGAIGAAIATALSIAAINGLKLLQVYAFYGLKAYSLSYVKGFTAIAAAGLICYLLRGWLFGLGCNPYAIMPLGGVAFLFAAALGFWLLGLEQDDKAAIAALRKAKGDPAI